MELRRYRLRRAAETSPEMEALDRLIVLVGYSASLSTGLERSLVLLRFAPLMGLMVTIGLLPFRVDGPFESIGGFSTGAFTVIDTLPAAILLLNPLVVRFGFRWKRAVFMGGIVERRRGFDLSSRYDGMVGPNIYEIENRVFRDLGERKRPEALADILLSPAVYFSLSITASIFARVIRTLTGGETVFEGVSGLIANSLMAAVIYWFLWQVLKRHRRRAAHGAAL